MVVSFDEQKCVSLIYSHLSIFVLVTCTLVSYPRNHCQIRWQSFSPIFSSRCFTVLSLTFSSYPFCINFCIWHKVKIPLYSFACGYLVFPTPFIKDTVFSSTEWSWHSCLKAFGHISEGLFPAFLIYSIHMYICPYATTTLFDYCNVAVCFEIRFSLTTVCKTTLPALQPDQLAFSLQQLPSSTAHSPEHWPPFTSLTTIQGSFPCSNEEITAGLEIESPNETKLL